MEFRSSGETTRQVNLSRGSIIRFIALGPKLEVCGGEVNGRSQPLDSSIGTCSDARVAYQHCPVLRTSSLVVVSG